MSDEHLRVSKGGLAVGVEAVHFFTQVDSGIFVALPHRLRLLRMLLLQLQLLVLLLILLALPRREVHITNPAMEHRLSLLKLYMRWMLGGLI